jgi:hypothetical protein
MKLASQTGGTNNVRYVKKEEDHINFTRAEGEPGVACGRQWQYQRGAVTSLHLTKLSYHLFIFATIKLIRLHQSFHGGHRIRI